MPDRHTTFTHAPERVKYVRTDRHGREDVVYVEGDHNYLCERQIELVRRGYKPQAKAREVAVHA